MALFTASNDAARVQEPAKRTSATPREATLSIVAAGLRVEGELITDGILKVEGVVVGNIRAEQQVLVAKGGLVEGNIYTREAILGGEVHGAVLAERRVEVQANSVIHGDITTLRIVVHEGGEVNGHIRMGDPKSLTERPVVGHQVRELPRPQAATH